MKKNSKKLLSVVLATVMVLCCLPIAGVTFSASAEYEGYYYYSVNNGKAEITDCNSSIRGDVVIPDTLGGYPVTSIGDYAFRDCTSLTSVTIGDSVTSIGYKAFYNCTGLTSITIPDSVTSIGRFAFYGCTGLTSITIPNSVTSIGHGTFSGCTGLTSITVSSGNTVYHSAGNCLIETKSKTLISGCNNSVIPSDGSVTSIDYYAFSACTGLTSITIPDSVTNIGNYAFYRCTGLTSVTVSTGNTVYHSAGNCLILTKRKTLIFGCKNSVIPSDGSVTSIGTGAFEDCTDLTSITIPDSVTSILWGAFSGCTGLTSITIPDSVTSIGGQAFSGCTGLTSVTIPDSVTSIGYCAFNGCTGLTSVTIPANVTDIGNNAFGYYSDINTKVENFTIYGYSNTAAETYANENGFAFIALDEEHTHTYSDWVVTTEPTCTAEGEETRTCSVCGESETRTIDATGHEYISEVVAPTCTESGYTNHTCKNCGDTYTDSEVAPIEHSYKSETFEATCQDKGKVVYTCENCGYSYTDEFDYGEHTYSDWLVTTEPTCTAEGEVTRTCIICGETETRTIETRTHDLFHVEVASTCTVTGVSCDVCSLCGKIFNYSVLPLVEHTFGEWTVTAEPTCTAEGEETRTCSVCGEAETRTIEKAAHKIVIDTSVTPTCTETGVTEGQHCSVCGEVLVEQQTIAAAGHNDNNSDGICDSCGENLGTHTPSENCSCSCHKKGIANFFFKILLFFQKLFKKNQVCKCGAWHY